MNGRNVFAIVTKKYLNQVPVYWEAHKKYADIHLLINGNETIGYCPIRDANKPIEFLDDYDNCLFKDLKGTDVDLGAGDFIILFPQDIHRANCQSAKGIYSRKIIFKVIL